jgi:hypothetical protein
MSTDSAISPTGSPKTGNPKALAAFVVVLTFVAGLIAGAAGDRILLFAQRRLIPQHRGFVTARLVERLDHELHFTPAQRVAVTQILEKNHRRVEAVWDGVRPQIREAIDATNREIEQVLDPDQRARFIALRARHRRPMMRRLLGGP